MGLAWEIAKRMSHQYLDPIKLLSAPIKLLSALGTPPETPTHFETVLSKCEGTYRKPLRVEAITCMHNEEYLLPFFLKHYRWVDKIHVICGEDSTDKTLEILKHQANVDIINYTFPNKLIDDKLRAEKINAEYRKLKGCDWVLLPDADEFIFTDKEQLARFDKLPVLEVLFYQVYRHVYDCNLNPALPVKEQRRHGYISENMPTKPIIAKPGLPIAWTEGNHFIYANRLTAKIVCRKIMQVALSKQMRARQFLSFSVGIYGAHWAMADPCFCVDRFVKDRAPRLSPYNLQSGMGFHYQGLTREKVLAECKLHEHDGVVF
jgi:hypothetical protein